MCPNLLLRKLSCVYLLIFFLIISCQKSANNNHNHKPVQSWTEEDRQFLLKGLENSRDTILSLAKTISPLDWKYKEVPESWSIADIVEHLEVHDELYYRELTVLTNLNETDEENLQDIESDENVLSYRFVTDKNKGNSPWYLEPRQRWESKEKALAVYSLYRNKLIDFVKNTDKDLRKYVTTSGRGNTKYRDLHQLVLISIAHSERHIHQLKTQIKRLDSVR